MGMVYDYYDDGTRRLSKILLVSGKMGAGKDTVSEPLAHALWPGLRVVRMAYADALRDEIDEIIGIIRSDRSGIGKMYAVCTHLDCSPEVANRIIGILSDDSRDASFNAHMHTPSTREALQYWGTMVRRADNPDYWCDKMRERIRSTMNGNRDVVVVIADGRFPNEIDLINELHGLTVRLDIERDEQVKRLIGRDGVEPDPEKLAHESETSLDDYEDFDARVDVTELDPTGVVDACVKKLRPIVDGSKSADREYPNLDGE